MAGRHPGTPKTGGRAKGSVNKATQEAKMALEELCRKYTPQALKALVDVATEGESEAARVSAAIALLDRAYGKPKQQTELTGAEGKDFVFHVITGVPRARD